MNNTTANQDQWIKEATEFGDINDAAKGHIQTLVEIMQDLDDQLSLALKDKGDER